MWQLPMFLNFLGGVQVDGKGTATSFPGTEKRERLLTCAKMNLFAWSKDGWTEPESHLSI